MLVTLSNETDYAMIAVMDGACDPNTCVNQNYYSVIFDAVAGQTYYFSIEGMGTAPSVSYDVSVLCNPPTFESDCADNLDNDGDFYIDCNSPCAPFSPPNPECDLIGAWPVGCGGSPAEKTTWGAMKALFRV